MAIQPFKDNPMEELERDQWTQEDEVKRVMGKSYGALDGLTPLRSESNLRDWDHPTVVCLCGSTRFGREFAEINLQMTLEGKIVLSIGCNMRDDTHIFEHYSQEEKDAIKDRLDALHLAKIKMADEVFVINKGGYIGSSTYREILFALYNNKRVRFLEPVIEIVRPS